MVAYVDGVVKIEGLFGNLPVVDKFSIDLVAVSIAHNTSVLLGNRYKIGIKANGNLESSVPKLKVLSCFRFDLITGKHALIDCERLLSKGGIVVNIILS